MRQAIAVTALLLSCSLAVLLTNPEAEAVVLVLSKTVATMASTIYVGTFEVLAD